MKPTRGKRAGFGAIFAAALGLFAAGFAPSAQAATRNVPGTYANIQSAINAASNGDVVLIAPGTYTGTGNRDVNFNGKAITVTSSGGAASTIIDCQGTSAAPHQAFLFNTNETSASVLQGLTIQHAYRPATVLGLTGGGAVEIDGASPTIDQCVFKNNTADAGGAIYISSGNASITQCDFIANLATISTLNVNDYGGAIYINAGLLGAGRISIADCTFQSNVANSDGGAIGVNGLITGLSVSIYNCSFYNNNAEGQGEVVSLSSEPGTIAFSGALNGSTTITNCVLYGDASPAELSTALPILTDNNVTYSDINQAGFAGSNHNISADPKYVAPANGNLHLGNGSPAIDAGTSAGAPTVDHDGFAWTGAVSMGAFDAAPATHFQVTASSPVTAGVPFTVSVTALDSHNNPAYAYAGPVHFTSTDPLAVLPADSAVTNGTGTFSTTLKTSGSQTVTVSASANSSISGTSAAITVNAAATTRVILTVPTNATAGSPFNVTVTALDTFGNTAPSYTGTIHFTSTDPQAVLPPNAKLTSGVGTFSATLKTAGNRTITATDTVTASITGTSGAIAVGTAAASHIVISGPANSTAGSPVTLTVTALDAFGNTAPSYTGTLHFTSTDPRAVLPANAKLTNGTGTFTATLKTAGSQTVTATDTVTASIAGTSNAVTIGAGATTMLLVRGRAPFTAGTPFQVSVAATDASGNTNSAFTGTVHFTSSDPQAVLPADTALVGGAANVNVTLKTSGTQTVTATVTTNSSITGAGTFAVTAGAAAHIVVNVPANASAGSPVTVTVRAADAFGNPAPTYTGMLHFTSSDPNAILPANTTLTGGQGTFQATLKTTGNQTLTVTDTANPALTGAASVTIGAGAATHVVVTAPASATAGSPVTVTVKAVDQFGNTATGYTGTLHFTSTDPRAVLPANAKLTNGVGTFQATLKTAGSQTVTATDTANPGLGGTTSPITIGAASTTRIVLTIPTRSPAGSPITITAQAVDQYGNPTSGYTGTIHFTSSDPNATLPADITLAGGRGTGQATLKTSGSQSITAADTANPGITGTGTITIGSGSAVKLVASAPASQIAGNTLTFTVKAVDQYGNVDPGYARTVRFTSSDHLASLPADTVLTGGSGSFTITLRISGAQTVTATDTSNAAFTGTSTITIIPGPPVMLQVRLRGPFVSGAQFSLNVFALDAYQNIAPTYTGTVHFTGSDSNAILPGDARLPGGSASFRATYLALGKQTITATDSALPNMTNTAAFVNTQPLASKFAINIPASDTAGTPIKVQVVALDSSGHTAINYTGTLHFTSTDPQAVLPMDTTLTNGVGTFSATPKTAGRLIITITDADNSTVTGSSGTEAVSPASATQITATAQTSAVSGTPFGVVVSALDPYGNLDPDYTGTVHFTSTDPQAVLPADTTLDAGQKTLQVTLKTVGSQTVTATDTVRRPAQTGKTAPITVTTH